MTIKIDRMEYPASSFALIKILLFFVSCQLSVFAYASCEAWKDGSTDQQACMVAEEGEKVRSEIKSVLKILIEKFKDMHMQGWVDRLVESQSQWEKYMGEQCELEEYRFGGVGHISQIRCEGRLSEGRLKELRAML